MLIELERKTDEYRCEGGQVIYLDTSFDQEIHRPIVGKVVAIPDDVPMEFGKWETDVELKVGDEVILRRIAVGAAMAHEKYVMDKDFIICIHYTDIVLAKRFIRRVGFDEQVEPGENQVVSQGGLYDVIMLNGYLLVEPEVEKLETFLFIPDAFKKESAMFGTIKFMGSPNKKYQALDGSYIPDTDFDISVGERIMFFRVGNIPLEYDIHRTFAGKNKGFFRMQRNNILAVV